MVIIAFDQSSKITGYSIFKDQQLVHYGVLNITNPSLDKRLVRIREAVQLLIDQWKPDKIYLEDIQMESSVGNNVVTYKALAEVIGVITELLAELKISYELIAPSSWRKKLHISGRSRADCKQKSKNYVLETYKITPTEDECDAICIGSSTFIAEQPPKSFNWA